MKAFVLIAVLGCIVGCEQPTTESDQWSEIRPLVANIQAALPTALDVGLYTYSGSSLYDGAPGHEQNLSLDLPYFRFTDQYGTTNYTVDLREVMILTVNGTTITFRMRQIITP